MAETAEAGETLRLRETASSGWAAKVAIANPVKDAWPKQKRLRWQWQVVCNADRFIGSVQHWNDNASHFYAFGA